MLVALDRFGLGPSQLPELLANDLCAKPFYVLGCSALIFEASLQWWWGQDLCQRQESLLGKLGVHQGSIYIYMPDHIYIYIYRYTPYDFCLHVVVASYSPFLFMHSVSDTQDPKVYPSLPLLKTDKVAGHVTLTTLSTCLALIRIWMVSYTAKEESMLNFFCKKAVPCGNISDLDLNILDRSTSRWWITFLTSKQ